MVECVHLIIRGRVQGVGFRHFLLHRAAGLGLSGWVRNRPDGAVEADAEGSRPALEELVQAVGRGPAGARVTQVEHVWGERVSLHRGFQVRD